MLLSQLSQLSESSKGIVASSLTAKASSAHQVSQSCHPGYAASFPTVISVLLLLNSFFWATQPPFFTNNLLILWVIIRVFDNQNGAGWPQPSREEIGHHAGVGSYNSRLLLYQVLPTPLVCGLTEAVVVCTRVVRLWETLWKLRRVAYPGPVVLVHTH